MVACITPVRAKRVMNYHPPFLEVLLVLLLLLSSLPPATSAVPPARILSGTEDCGPNGEYDLTTFCSDDQFALGDERYSGGEGQCRTACYGFSNSDIDVTHILTRCGFCSKPGASDFIIPEQNICIPRGVCIDQCGPEQQGCVYTGSCEGQICFKGPNSEKPAVFKRITHAGPGTWLVVDNSVNGTGETAAQTTFTRSIEAPGIITNGEDSCSSRQVSFEVETFECSSDMQPLSDDRSGSSEGQCRAFCYGFAMEGVEIVRVPSTCDACSKSDVDTYFDKDTNQVCVPRSKCIELCGPERPGCAYTGSCGSQICFSGADSKKPAVFTTLTDDGDPSAIEVDNDGPPLSIDPPAYANLSNSTQAPVPSPTTTKSPVITAGPNPSPLPPVVARESNTPSPQPNSSGSIGSGSPTRAPISPTPADGSGPGSSTKQDEGGTTIWVWLGPILGVLGAGITAMATVVAALIRRRRSQDSSAVPPPQPGL